MARKLGFALLFLFVSALIYAAAQNGIANLGNTLTNDGSAMLQAMGIQTAATAAIAPDQTPVSLSSELPAHDPTVGKVAGSASTSGGAASYSIPIALPPGRRGMQPSISLSYSSRAGNGIAGMGWSLSGLSSLHRCPATIEQDGMVGAVSLTNADKLCLDGQRLIPTSGAYGQPNTTHDTELESFVRVTQLGGDLQSASTYFEVETKSGEILWYGNNSAAANSARVVPGGVSVPLSWMLAFKSDRVGNFIHYIYTDYGNGEVLLTDVAYTGFGTLDGDRHVKFSYQARPSGATDNDQSSSYLAGGVTRQTQRLSVISTWTTNAEEVSEYRLTYNATTSQSTHRSLLASVTQCGFLAGVSACRPPTTFSWQQGPIQTAFHPAVLPSGLSVVNVVGDYIGDGSHEILAKDASQNYYLESLNPDQSIKASLALSSVGGINPYAFAAQESTDFDLGGKSDVLAIDPVTYHIVIYFWDGPSNATTFAQAFTRSWDTGILGLDTVNGGGLYGVRDMDGDGRPDIIVSHVDPTQPASCHEQVQVYRNVPNPSGASLPASFSLIASQCLAETNVSGSWFGQQPVGIHDINGDGLPDILISPPYSTYLGTPRTGSVLLGRRASSYGFNLVSYASLFPASDPLTGAENDTHGLTEWLDANGDGLEDLVNAGPNGQWTLRLNTGNGFGSRIQLGSRSGIEDCGTNSPTPMNPSCTQVWQPWYAGRIQVADIDGDGRKELLVPGAFASLVCTYLVDRSNPAEPAPYYGCPGGATAAVSNLTTTWDVRDLYLEGMGAYDQSAYLMDALHIVETGPNQFQMVAEQTTQVSGYQDSRGDLFGVGLESSFTHVACKWSRCKLGTGPGAPTTLPGGYPLLSTGPFINDNRGPNSTLNPDGKTPELPDLMSMVTDGLGAQTVWTYYPLSSTAGRTAGQTPLYTVPASPAQRYVDDRHSFFTSSMPVVSDMSSSDGLGGFHTLRYGYSQAMYNEQGRGFQGFRTIIEEDATVGLRTTTTFNQKFPLAGQVADVVVNALTRSGTDGAIKHETYTWRCNRANRSDATACTPPNGNATIKFPYLDKKETWTYDSGVALQASGTPQQIGYSQDVNANDTSCAGTGFATASGFDAYGNLTGHTVLSSDSGTGTGGLRAFVAMQCQRTVASYTASTSTWWLDQINSTSTTSAITYNTTNHQLPAGASNPAQTVTTSYLWNTDRTLATQTVQSGVTNQQKVTSYAYPSSNNYGLPSAVAVAASGDPNGTRSSSIVYSSDGYFPSIAVNALGQSAQTTISPRDGQPTLAIDANGLRTLMTYDVFGQLIRTQFHGTSDSVQVAPDKLFARSWCVSTCLPGPQALFKTTDVQDGTPTRIIAYDQLGRTLLSAQWAWDNTLPLVLTQYNAQGQVSAQSNPYDGTPQHLFWTTFQYDAIGRVTQKVVPKGADDGRGDLKTTYAFSGLQTAIQVCGTADVGTGNCLNLTRTTDSMGKYMETVDAQGGLTRYWTDATGNTLALVDAKGSVTTAAYNAIGQRSSVSDPNQGTWGFAYNALGEVLSQTDARNVVTTSSYDKLGRPLTRNATVDVTGDGVADNVADSWTYDPLNGVGKPATSQRLVNGAIERKQVYTYDTLARPIQTDTTQQIATGTTKAYTQTIAYDSYYGRPKSTGYPNGEAVATYYSKYGIPVRSFNPLDNTVYREVTAVDLSGLPTVANLGGGVLTDNRSYRIATGQLTEIKTTKGGATARQLDYQYDVYGNLTQQSLNVGATIENYAYDTLQRMTQATRTGAVSSNITYAYDAVGNFTSKSDFSTTAANAYTYTGGVCGGGPNAVKSVATPSGTRSYCYDADGNLTSDSVGLAVKYDHDNLAFQTTRGASTIYLAYGPDNQRTRQWGSDGTKVYVDGYEDWISAGSTKVYVGGDAEITTTSAGRTVNFLLTDRLGSVDSIADATGNLIETRGSDSFGKPRSGTWTDLSPARIQSTAITEHGFTGHEHLNSVELIHMNGRVYDYALGRFLSVDPFIQFPLNSQSLNPYSYILNNPLAGTDPTGYLLDANPGCGKGGENSCVTPPEPSPHDSEQHTGSHIAGHVDAEMQTSAHVDSSGHLDNGGDSGQGANRNTSPTANVQNQPASAPGLHSKNNGDVGTSGLQGAQKSDGDLPQVSDAPGVDPNDKTNVDPIKTIKRMVDLLNQDIREKGTDLQKQAYAAVRWIYDPDRQDFKDDPKMAAYSDPAGPPNIIYVGRRIVAFADTEHGSVYPGVSFNRGGDSALLFVGLHEFAHVYLRPGGGDNLIPADRERAASKFAQGLFPRKMSGSEVKSRDLSFPKEGP